MRRRLTLVALVLPLALAGAAAGASAQGTLSVTTFAISGRGWGHGVGMGQWGALGLARSGANYDKILAYYYRGTELGQASPGAKIRVLLVEGTRPVTVGSPVPFRLRDGDGTVYELGAGTYAVGRNLSVRLDPTKPASPLTGPLTFLPGSVPLELGRRPYRGQIELQAVGKKLQVVNVVGLDAYVRGVVNEEVPDRWPLEAVKAQAVAARSYAVAVRRDKLVLYADTRGQVYGGILAETPSGNEAVAETRGQVLLYQGRVATTYFFSSSGGRTASYTDLVPNAKPVPYLVSVKDPYDVISPYHTWGPVLFSAAQVSKRLHFPGATDLVTVPSTGRARQVIVTTTAGGETTVSASAIRGALGLRSTWFKVGVLSLSRPAGPSAPGAPVTLTGLVRRVQGPVTLEQQAPGEDWQPGPAVTLAPDGTFSVAVGPSETTLYRLSATLAGKSVQSKPLPVRVEQTVGSAARPARTIASASSRAAGRAPHAAAFTPSDPLAPRQWYLAADRAFDLWPQLPALSPVKVAVIDTGIDLEHPEFAGKIIAQRSFVGGTVADRVGHGTFVAGVLAAAAGNGQGIAGIAFPAQLIVAKVVGADGTINPELEAKAIRWAVGRGAKVINLSLGGLRDPVDPKRDTYSPAEEAAIEYAYGRGAVIVAAVGNGDQAPSSPWPYASYPAALPHVIGVSALAQDGSVPPFSNRDAVYNDVSAPGEAIVSTLPRALTAVRPSCPEQGYSICGPPDYRDAAGTSFAAPQVSAAAALMLAVRPDLAPDQVSMLVERSAVDVNAATGCRRCPLQRDMLSGWGRLDITAALQVALDGPLPPSDRFESNDDAGRGAATLWGRTIAVEATIDFWDDQVDVYRVKLRAGERVAVAVQGPEATTTSLVLWKPGTQHVNGLSLRLQTQRATQSVGDGPDHRLTYGARRGGWYYVEVKIATPGSGEYTLRITKSG